MALEGGVPVAVLGPFHQQLATSEQVLQLGVAQLHGAAAHGQLGLDPAHTDQTSYPGSIPGGWWVTFSAPSVRSGCQSGR